MCRNNLKQPENMSYDINYNYRPNKIHCIHTKFILFKASRKLSMNLALVNESMDRKIATHYLDCTEDNYLSEVCDATIEIIKMEASHFDWIENIATLKSICSTIKGELCREHGKRSEPIR